MPDPVAESEPTRAYGPVEDSDATRQAQHSISNDAPTDVNFNAIAARSQELTVEQAGRNFTAAADRRSIIADAMLMGLPKE